MQPISDREPAGMVVGSHASYRAARQDADSLVSHGFPPDRVSVRVRGLRLVRRRLPSDTSLRRAAGGGLLVGAIGGLLGLWVAGVVPALPAGTVLAVAAGGAVAWAAVGVARGLGVPALRARWQGRAGVEVLEADGYDVAVDDRVAEAARRLLYLVHRRGDEPGSSTPSNHPRSDPAPGTATEPSQRGRGSGRPRPGERRQAKARTSRTMTRASTATKIQNISHHRPATRSALGPNGSTGGGPRPQPASRPTVAPAKTSRRRARWRWLPGLAMSPSRAAGASRGGSWPRDGRNGPPSFRCKTPGPDRLGVETV